MVLRTDYSDVWPLAVQRRYHMPRRSLLLFWLLLAATISVDLVVLGSAGLFDGRQHLETVFFALAFGELSTICIWVTFSTQPYFRRSMVFGGAVATAALATWLVEPADVPIVESIALNATHATVLLLALGLYKMFMAFRQRLATAAQFSIKDLFVLTTLIAVLAALLHQAKMLQLEWTFIAFLTLNNVALAITSLVFWSRPWHWIFRSAATLALALVGGWCLTLLNPHLSGDLEVMSCLQAFIILVWLELGGIVPHTSDVNDADAAIASMTT